MKTISRNIAILVILVLFGCNADKTVEIFVDTNGLDTNKGTIESPYKSLTKAKSVVQDLLTKNKNQNINVNIRGGIYKLTNTFVLGLNDTPADNFRVTYKAYKDETPIITSGANINRWNKVDVLPKGFPKSAKGKLFVADFPEGVNKPYSLFDGMKRIVRAKKDGFHIKEFKDYEASKSMNVYNNEDRYMLRRFFFDDPKKILKKWDNISDIEIGFAPVPWAMNILPLEKIDFKNNIGWIAIEANAPAGAKNSHTQPWIENAPEYISEGTFVTKTKEREIYYWPKSDKPSKNIVVPTLREYVKIEGKINYNKAKDIPAKNITIKGITFMHGERNSWKKDHKGWGIQHDWDKFDCANAMLRLRGAENCSIEECRFTNSAGSAIRLDLHCQNISVTENLIDYVGHMGVLVCGYGPGTKDVNKNNNISNNLIHHVGQVIKHGAGIFVWQSGYNTVSNNVIHHVPRKGVGICGIRMPILEKAWCDFDEASKTIRWNEINANIAKEGSNWFKFLPFNHARNNVVENNEIYRALEYLADGSVLNVSGAAEGNIVRNNFVHHIASHASGVLRTDDWQRGTTFENNIIYMANISGIVHKGFNHIVNNMIIDCSTKESIRFASYPDEVADYGSKIQHNIFYESSNKINYYRESYRASEGISLPKNSKTDFNTFYCAGNPEIAQKYMELQRKDNIEKNSIMADPKFVDLKNRNFKLQNDSPALKIGFKQIDMSNLGLMKNYPVKYKNLDVKDDGRRANFHRHIKKGKNLYDFW